MPVTLMPGQALNVSVRFEPTSAQAYTGTLVFSRANSSTITVYLSGAGTHALAQVPAITNQPSNQAVVAGQTATFSVAATGTAPLTFQWKKNGTTITGASSFSYTTPPETTPDSNSQFSVTVGNIAGNAISKVAMLTVTAAGVAPSITTQPVSADVNVGQTATFSVTAAGTFPLSYQWQKNGAAISGANSAT
jgi:hypothetical protein